MRNGFGRGIAFFQCAVHQQRQARNRILQAFQVQRGGRDVQVWAVFQCRQILADGLLNRQQFGLLEAAQPLFQAFQHVDGDGDVARQQKLLRCQVQRHFHFVHQPVHAAFEQFAVCALHAFQRLLALLLHGGYFGQFLFDFFLAQQGVLQQDGILAVAHAGFVQFLFQLQFLRVQQILPLHEQEAAGAQPQQGQHQRAHRQAFAARCFLLNHNGRGGWRGCGRRSSLHIFRWGGRFVFV